MHKEDHWSWSGGQNKWGRTVQKEKKMEGGIWGEAWERRSHLSKELEKGHSDRRDISVKACEVRKYGGYGEVAEKQEQVRVHLRTNVYTQSIVLLTQQAFCSTSLKALREPTEVRKTLSSWSHAPYWMSELKRRKTPSGLKCSRWEPESGRLVQCTWLQGKMPRVNPKLSPTVPHLAGLLSFQLTVNELYHWASWSPAPPERSLHVETLWF